MLPDIALIIRVFYICVLIGAVQRYELPESCHWSLTLKPSGRGCMAFNTIRLSWAVAIVDAESNRRHIVDRIYHCFPRNIHRDSSQARYFNLVVQCDRDVVKSRTLHSAAIISNYAQFAPYGISARPFPFPAKRLRSRCLRTWADTVDPP